MGVEGIIENLRVKMRVGLGGIIEKKILYYSPTPILGFLYYSPHLHPHIGKFSLLFPPA